MSNAIDRGKIRTMILRMLTGAVAGAAITGLFLVTIGDLGNFSDPSRILATFAGLTYALMGLGAGFGTLAPRLGATFLNVEDADEISEERRVLGTGSAVSLLVGVLFIALALTPSGDYEGALPRDVAAGIAAVSFVALVGLSLWMSKHIDELNRALAAKSSALAMNVSMLLFGGWAAFAHLGYVPWIAPLALVSGLAIVQLASVFWVIGKRGMLVPR